jgi:hypothetical protein
MALVLALIYFVVRPSRPSERTQTAAPGPLESAPAAAKVENSQYAKNLELAGFRISEDKNQRVSVRFLVVNHSAGELPPLKGEVTLKTGRADAVIDFPFVLSSLGPYEVKEVTSNTKTEIRAYELPDWQFIKPEFTVTETEAPAGTPAPAPAKRRRR